MTANPLWIRRVLMLAAFMLLATPGGMSAANEPPSGLPRAWQDAAVMPLWPDGPPETGYQPQSLPDDWPPVFLRNVAAPEMRIFRPEKSNGRALLVIPGGAYIFVSIENEGVDVADAMTRRGYTVFVLVHRLPGEGWHHRADVALQDAQRAMRLIRRHAGDFGYDPQQIAALGFSAGGHLAASLTTNFDETVYSPRDEADQESPRPVATGLIYPVISMTAHTHADSARMLLGPQPSADLVARRSPAEHVSDRTPPVFLMHALDDPAVPPENSRIMENAMRTAGRPVEAHFFEEGGHGFGLGAPDLPVHQWPGLFDGWLARQIQAKGETR